MANLACRNAAVFLVLASSVAATGCGEDDNASPTGTGGTEGAGLGGAGDDSGASGGASASTGGQSPGGGSSTGGAGIIATGPTGQCPAWPKERFFPLVGVFFYGTDPMPCTRTSTPSPDVSSPLEGIYDLEYDTAGYVVRMTNRDGSVNFAYTRDAGVIVSEVDTMSTGQTTVTYHYGANSAGYEVSSGSTIVSSFEYALDARGYPLSISSSYTSSSAPAYLYVYEYDGCKLKQRTAYVNGTLDSNQTQTYEYDAEGRIIAIKSENSIESFDYSCP